MRQFWKFISLVVFDDSIYPIRKGAVSFDQLFNSRLPDGNYDFKLFKDDIAQAYEKERRREERKRKAVK